MTKKSAANQKLGKTMRAIREEQGYNQEVFARRAKLDRANYGSIERGEFNISVDTLSKISAGFGIKIQELFKKAGL
jgi:transcriptional regulator with XRE-family HTH domain